MRARPIYCIDTSSLVEASTRYYPADMLLSAWSVI